MTPGNEDGIIFGMKSSDFSIERDEILAVLNGKLLDALAAAVRSTRDSLAAYRSRMPDEAASHSPRGLANIIHDWLWDHLRRELYGLEEAAFVEGASTREIIVQDHIRIRVKRLTPSGAVATYPTETALSFYEQCGEQLVLFSPSEVKLVFGYFWDPHLQEVGAAAVARPISTKQALWVHAIPESEGEAVFPGRRTTPLPGLFAAEGGPRGAETGG